MIEEDARRLIDLRRMKEVIDIEIEDLTHRIIQRIGKETLKIDGSTISRDTYRGVKYDSRNLVDILIDTDRSYYLQPCYARIRTDKWKRIIPNEIPITTYKKYTLKITL